MGCEQATGWEESASFRSPPSSAISSAWAVAAAFGAYFCMYGFRKPFTVAAYDDVLAWGYAYKPLAIVAQVMGYMASKFIGIKVIAELERRRRVAMLLLLITVAEAALVGFALTPAPWNLAWLFVNGLPLGIVFGLVLSFLEGRRQTEALAAGLCSSFIVADGVTKSVGMQVLSSGVSEFWMPAFTGCLFAAPLALFAWMLTRIPPPSIDDVAQRCERSPMMRRERRDFFRRYGIGLSLLVVAYLLITVLRSVRADFAPEIWQGLGEIATPGDFATVEMIVAGVVLILFGGAAWIADHRRAFFYALFLALIGAIAAGAAPTLRRMGLSPYGFMVFQGLGLYLPYIAVHTTIFERLIAMTRDRGNIGYLLYLADAIGYLGYVGVLLLKSLFRPGSEFFPFYERLSLAIGLACVAVLIPCWRYFVLHPATRSAGLAHRRSSVGYPALVDVEAER